MTKTARICAVAAVLILPTIAEATVLGTVTMEHTGYGAKGLMKVWGGGFDGEYVFGGVHMFKKTAGTGQGDLWPNWPNGQLGGFCIELSEWVSKDSLKYDVVMPEYSPKGFLEDYMGRDKADYLAELWDEHFDPNWVDGPFDSNEKSNAEAFAAAVWEIIYEDLPAKPNEWNVEDGTFYCKYADTATANDWLHELDGSGGADLRALVYNGSQDYIVEVPEPATIALLGLGSLALLRKRKSVT